MVFKETMVVSLSTAEAENIAAATCVQEVLYLQGFSNNWFQMIKRKPCDGTCQQPKWDFSMMKNYKNSRRTKQIDKKYILSEISLRIKNGSFVHNQIWM